MTRRALLRVAAAGAAAYAVAGCGIFDRDPDREPAADPLEPLRVEALRLAGLIDAVVVAHPELAALLNPIREAHLAHAAEVARVTGAPTTAPAAETPSGATGAGEDPRAAVAALRVAEQSAQRTATDLCLAAPASRAALVGSIVAALATHQEVLR